VDSPEKLRAAHDSLEEFIRTHPGDPTAISAGLSYTYAERRLTGENE
jgi:hypothetical protein